MIIWSGKGIIPVLVLIVSLIIGMWIVPDKNSDYGFVIGLFLTAGFSWYFGPKWNRNPNERILVDEKTGQRVSLRKKHSLFWIPVQYWGIIFSVFGIIILLQNSVIAGAISVLILLVLILLTFKKKNISVDYGNNYTSKPKIASMREQKSEDERKRMEAEEEAERMRRRKEKEDPSRFMPK